MDTNRIKRFATEARNILKAGIAAKITTLGFDKNGNVAEENKPQLMQGGSLWNEQLQTEGFYYQWMSLYNRIQQKGISEVYEEWQEETGVKVIAVSIDQAQNINKVKPLVNQHGWPYEVLLDSNSEFRKSFGGEMIPFVIICDGEGKVVFKHNGYTEGAEQELIEKVRELIK